MNHRALRQNLFRIFYYLGGGLVLATWSLSLLYYPALPDEIPVHFDAEGMPARLVDKTAAGVFMTPFLETVVFLLLVGMHYLATHLRDLRELFNWPGSTYLSNEVTEGIRNSIVQWTLSLSLVGLSWISHRHYISLEIMRMQRYRAVSAETAFLSALFWVLAIGMTTHLFILVRRGTH